MIATLISTFVCTAVIQLQVSTTTPKPWLNYFFATSINKHLLDQHRKCLYPWRSNEIHLSRSHYILYSSRSLGYHWTYQGFWTSRPIWNVASWVPPWNNHTSYILLPHQEISEEQVSPAGACCGCMVRSPETIDEIKPNTNCDRYGGLNWSPYSFSYLWPSVPVAWLSWIYIRSRYLAFWSKVSILMAKAILIGYLLDSG